MKILACFKIFYLADQHFFFLVMFLVSSKFQQSHPLALYLFSRSLSEISYGLCVCVRERGGGVSFGCHWLMPGYAFSLLTSKYFSTLDPWKCISPEKTHLQNLQECLPPYLPFFPLKIGPVKNPTKAGGICIFRGYLFKVGIVFSDGGESVTFETTSSSILSLKQFTDFF